MKHLFVVNPVAGKLSGAEKFKVIEKTLAEFPGLIKEIAKFEIYLTKAPMDAIEKIRTEAESERNCGYTLRRRWDAQRMRKRRGRAA